MIAGRHGFPALSSIHISKESSMFEKQIVCLTGLVLASWVSLGVSFAESETATTPKDMVYVSHGSFMMGKIGRAHV